MVKVWDAATGQESLTLRRHTMYIRSVAFSPDGRDKTRQDKTRQDKTRQDKTRQDKTVKVWDARSWTPELRAQSQARGLLTVKRDRGKWLEELQATIRSDKTIPELVRKQAVDWAEPFWKNRQTTED
jgi:WD40 repeat protein